MLAVWAQSSHEPRRHSQEGERPAWCANVGFWVHRQISLGHSEAPPKGPGMSWCEPASEIATRPGVQAQEVKGWEGSLGPTGTLLMWPGVWEEVLGASYVPEDM